MALLGYGFNLGFTDTGAPAYDPSLVFDLNTSEGQAALNDALTAAQTSGGPPTMKPPAAPAPGFFASVPTGAIALGVGVLAGLALLGGGGGRR